MKKKLKLLLHYLFDFIIILKGLDWIIDIIWSVILLFYKSDIILNKIALYIHKDLIEDPNDYIATHLLTLTQNFLPDTTRFIWIYLGIHWLIKVWLITTIYIKNHKVYKTAQIILTFFICYQLYRFFHTHSIILLIFTFIDIIIVLLLQQESRNLAKK